MREHRAFLKVVIILMLVTLTSTASHVNAGNYDRGAAVSYADTWAHTRNSNYPNYGSGCGCNDCTNYISQVLHNGGYPLRTGNWDENSIFEWWYRKRFGLWWQNSKTWSAADWLNTYVHQYQAAEFEIRSWPTDLEAGDFYLMDLYNNDDPDQPPDGKPDHGRVIVGYGLTSTNQGDYTDGCGNNKPIPPQTDTLLANQHCVDRWHVAWDYEIPGSVGRWSIHVKW